MTNVKIYRVEGVMLISADKLPTWQRFSVEVRALNEKHALEYIYSVLGSRHKVKRANIKILKIEEIPLEKAESKYVRDLSTLTRMVIK
ncbi:50S ribosomal protein L18Ae [Ignisphaera sp. 4213-co]|uniref:Large ribosomal subunit protein eL20 n=1 Tax=Ignisphaera cupida TaxID=3050454 RepID=A0ABD4Z5D1_9CREN|nr:50S ribosomal protein L18Ae [Ignisphaera sp. 4213-co]MDK6028526.1 50S ribosomal protein L18Ae [Ignisphaera sp. 4213-co]